MCVDVLLRCLTDKYASSTLRAFADDVGMILNNWQMLPGVVDLFSDFAKFSGLKLNWPKTVIVPLWGISVPHFHRLLWDARADLTKMDISTAAKYLGVWLGPGAALIFWDAAIASYTSRIKRWSCTRLGLQLLARCYNTFVVSVLSYLLQFTASCIATYNRRRCFPRRQ